MTDTHIGMEDYRNKKTELIKRVFAEKAACSSVGIFKKINRACEEGGTIEATILIYEFQLQAVCSWAT